MTWERTLSVDGFEFLFIGDSGVCVDPEVHDVSNRLFIAALKKAVIMFPVVGLIQHAEILVNEVFRHSKSENAEDLTKDALAQWDNFGRDALMLCQKALKETVVQVPKESCIYKYIDCLMEADRRIKLESRKNDLKYRSKENQNNSAEKEKERSGYVYLAYSPTGQYKIGRSKNAAERIKTFSVRLPFSIELIHTIECVDMYKTERNLHIKFSENRINGEWFNLPDVDVAWIKSIKSDKDL